MGEQKREKPIVHAASSPVRCPYCHDAVDRDKDAWVACQGCLARHHAGCWQEGGACSGCGETEFASPEVHEHAAETYCEDAAPPTGDEVVPSIQVDLRGRRAHFEGDPTPLTLIPLPGSDREAFEVHVTNETPLPQRVEVRRLPGWLVPEGPTAYEIPAGVTARFRLVAHVDRAPQDTVPNTPGRTRGAHALGMSGKVASGGFVLSTDDDSMPIQANLAFPITARARAGLNFILSTFGLHVGVIFLVTLAFQRRPPERHQDESDADFVLRLRRSQVATHAFNSLNRWVVSVLGVLAVLIPVILLANS